MLSKKIRKQFLSFFESKAHQILPSSAVVPHDDPTLLFTNAGMNQFKDIFLGKSNRDLKRAATSQKCIRVGGKHNDFENVGHTSRHLSFFEMLGNFSFGDYFKSEAIEYAWHVSTEIFQLDPGKIWPTVYHLDEESFEIWRKYVPAERITKLGEKDNFWSMGETGPCGPCSELLYDKGSRYGAARSPLEDPDGERFFEFWNLVFMQHEKLVSGQIIDLPKPSIDTGAGLERVVGLKMGVDNVFETDILAAIIAQISNLARFKYDPNSSSKAAFHVIADHIRSLCFAIADGAQPSNVDRGYVLRKLLRRACRYGKEIGLQTPFLHQIVPTVIAQMGEDFPELNASESRICEIVTVEEETLARTLQRGGNLLHQVVESAKASSCEISGEDAFKLKDTYGLPFEEISLIAKDMGLKIDKERFDQLETQAKELSKSSRKTAANDVKVDYSFLSKITNSQEFPGYENLQFDAKILAIKVKDSFVDELETGVEADIFLDNSCFYPEMGGQVGDIGTLSCQSGSFQVVNTMSPQSGLAAHQGKLLSGKLKVGDKVQGKVDSETRLNTCRNHTATHLLHWALQEVLGAHIKQAGSVVDDKRVRFDFSHHKPLTAEEIAEIEGLVNQKVRQNRVVETYSLDYSEAQKRADIKQFFGDKYGAKVRVVDIDYSKELCGGTHLKNVGQIGLFKIVKEGSISAGVRRIEAVTGHEAELHCSFFEKLTSNLAELLQTSSAQLEEKALKIIEENKKLQKEVAELKKTALQQIVTNSLQQKELIGDSCVILLEVDLLPADLKYLSEQIMQKDVDFVCLISKHEGRGHCLIKVSKNLVAKKCSAKEMLKIFLTETGGSGGGKEQMAQGSCKLDYSVSEDLFLKIMQLIKEELKNLL